jgi:hypothetical protein
MWDFADLKLLVSRVFGKSNVMEKKAIEGEFLANGEKNKRE